MKIDGGLAFNAGSDQSANVIYSWIKISKYIHFQVLIGQYSRAGPLRIWRSFPLARGFGICWLILIFLITSIKVNGSSINLVYIYDVSIERWNSINIQYNFFLEGAVNLELASIALEMSVNLVGQ